MNFFAISHNIKFGVFFGGLALILGFVLGACGDNPEKARVFVPDESSFLESLGGEPLKSENGNTLVFQENSKEFKAKTKGDSIKFNIDYRFATPTRYQVEFVNTSFQAEVPVVKPKETVDIINKKFPNEILGSGSSYEGVRLGFEVACVAETQGNIVKIIPRPSGDLQTFGDREGYKYHFQSSPNAKWIVGFEMVNVTHVSDYEFGGLNYQRLSELLLGYFDHAQLRKSILAMCNQSQETFGEKGELKRLKNFGYRTGNTPFSEFFNVGNFTSVSYDSMKTKTLKFTVPVSQLSPNMFLISLSSDQANLGHSLKNLGSQLFVSKKQPYSLTSLLEQANYPVWFSGRSYGVHGAQKVLADDKKITLKWDFRSGSFNLTKEPNSKLSDFCEIKISGKTAPLIYNPWESLVSRTDKISAELEIDALEKTDCQTPPPSSEKWSQGHKFLIFFSVDQKTTELTLRIIDSVSERDVLDGEIKFVP